MGGADRQDQMEEEHLILMIDVMSAVSVDTMLTIALEVKKDMEKVVDGRGPTPGATQEAEAGAGVVIAPEAGPLSGRQGPALNQPTQTEVDIPPRAGHLTISCC